MKIKEEEEKGEKGIWSRVMHHPPVNIQSSIPDEVALKIVSSLQVTDVCSLGTCSRFWRDLCGSDCVWEALLKERWPEISGEENFWISCGGVDQEDDSNSKAWRALYINKHNEMARKTASVKSFIERAGSYESIEVGNYLKAIELLNSLGVGFKDVEMFLLKPELSVLLNLVGLHYCIIWLDVPAEYVIEALKSRCVSKREVCVQWWKLGRWFYGFRLRDEFHSRNVCLVDMDEEVLGVLRRGAVHEVIRVQISAAKPAHISWSSQVARV